MRRLAGPVLLAALAGGILLPNANGATADPPSTGAPGVSGAAAPGRPAARGSAGLATLILARQSPAGRTVANHPAAVLARPASPAHVPRRGMVWPGCDTPLV
jgi:hypothetical protein